MKISVCIPTYEYRGKGVECLEHSFLKLSEQTFKDFDVVISDHSQDDEIENFCKKDHGFKINYFRNYAHRGNPAANTNNAMEKATGEWLKLLCQDDYLFNAYSLKIISNEMEYGRYWIATGYVHTYNRTSYQRYHAPYTNSELFITNTIGTPSCTAFRNIRPIMKFDEALYYAYDCEFYYRFYKKYGPPVLLNDTTIVNYLWNNSITAGVTQDFIQKENEYILKKHGLLK